MLILWISWFVLCTLDIYRINLNSVIRYSGIVLCVFGMVLFLTALFSLYLSLVFIANILFWKYLEKKELEQRFISYKEYKKSTIF